MADTAQNIDTTEVIDPSNGQIGTVPTDSLSDALESGFRVATSAEHAAAVEKAQYGERPFTAAAIGAVKSALPFGSGVAALKALGVPSETLTKVPQYNPIPELAGEVGGLFIPSPIGLGKLASAAGKAVSGLAEKVASKVAAKVLAQPAARAVGGAVEGAIFGGSNFLNESVIGNGDPSLTAESVLGNVGMSALWGAGIGGALGLGVVTIPPAINKARGALSDTMDSLGLSSLAAKAKERVADTYAGTAAVFSGLPKEDIKAAIINRGTKGVPLDTEDVVKNLSNHVDALEGARKTALSDIRPKEIENLVAQVDPGVAQNEASKIYSSFDSAINTMRSEPELYPPTYARQLELIRDSIPRRIPSESTPVEIYNSLNDLKRQLDTKIPYEKIPSVASQNAIGVIRDLRSGIKGSLEDTSIWGQAGARQAGLNDALTDYLKSLNTSQQKGEFAKQFMYKAGGQLRIDPTKVETFLKNAQSTKGIKSAQALSNYIDTSNNLVNQIEETYKSVPDTNFNKQELKDFITRNSNAIEQQQQQAQLNKLARGAEGTKSEVGPLVIGGLAHAMGLPNAITGVITAAADALLHPGQFINRLAKLESSFASTQQRVAKAARVLASPSSKLSGYAQGFVAGKLPIDNKDKYKKITTRIADLTSSPEMTIETLSKNTGDLQPHAPKTTAAMQQAAGRALQFLRSKIPTPQFQGPLEDPPEPSEGQIKNFARYYKAVEDPLSVLKDAANGTLTVHGVEALGNVYPSLYQHIRDSVAGELVKSKERGVTLPYHRRLMLSLLTGTSMDGSTQPQSILANQSTLNVSAMQQAQKDMAFVGQPKARAKGLDELGMSNRALTAQQQSAQRAQET